MLVLSYCKCERKAKEKEDDAGGENFQLTVNVNPRSFLDIFQINVEDSTFIIPVLLR